MKKENEESTHKKRVSRYATFVDDGNLRKVFYFLQMAHTKNFSLFYE